MVVVRTVYVKMGQPVNQTRVNVRANLGGKGQHAVNAFAQKICLGRIANFLVSVS